MTELELVYKVLTSSGKGRINNSDVMSERLIRSIIYEQRANLLLNFTSNGRKIPQLLTQDFNIEVVLDDNQGSSYRGSVPSLIDLGKTRSLTYVNDFYSQLSVNHDLGVMNTLFDVNREEKYKRVNTCRYNHRTNELLLTIDNSDTKRLSALNVLKGAEVVDTIDGVDKYNKYKIYAVGILYNPSDCPDFNWKKDAFPLPQTLERPLMELAIKEYNLAVKSS